MGAVMVTTYSRLPYSLADQMRQDGRLNRSVRRGERQKHISTENSRPGVCDVVQNRVANIALKRVLLQSSSFGVVNQERLITPIEIAQLQTRYLSTA